MSNTGTQNNKDSKKNAPPPGAADAAPLSALDAKVVQSSGLSAADLDAMRRKIAEEVKAAGATLEDKRSDVVGYWASEVAPIYCRPLHVKLFDGQLEEKKPSALLTVEALASTLCTKNKEEDSSDTKEMFVCKKGDLIGIWVKPGMRDLLNCGNVPTTITYSGTKKVHKKPGMNPMKVYAVKGGSGGVRIPVEEDRREQSAGVATFFDVKKPSGSNGLAVRGNQPSDASAAAEDEIPF